MKKASSPASQWGPCQTCKWWQIEPGTTPRAATMGLCIEEKLQPYRLRVSGSSGCNCWMEGKPAKAKGSSAAPPTAKPTR